MPLDMIAAHTHFGGDERAAIWPVMTAQWPAYDEYVEKAAAAGRPEIPVIVLERV